MCPPIYFVHKYLAHTICCNVYEWIYRKYRLPLFPRNLKHNVDQSLFTPINASITLINSVNIFPDITHWTLKWSSLRDKADVMIGLKVSVAFQPPFQNWISRLLKNNLPVSHIYIGPRPFILCYLTDPYHVCYIHRMIIGN